MCICLLCGEKMIEKSSSSKDNISSKYKHKEHIIQNALGGRLKNDSILCEECGNKLGKEIDADFVKLFSIFTEQLSNFSKERNGNSKIKLYGKFFIDGEEKRIVKIKNEVFPEKPFYKLLKDNSEIRIYGSKQAIKQYKNKVLEEVKGPEFANFAVKEITNLLDDIYLFFSEGVEKFNDKFRMGFIKIATEFAYMNGIDRFELKRTLDTKNNNLIYTNNIFPFCPMGLFDHYYEQIRNEIEKEYPTHTIILFTQKNNNNSKVLFCYIDLFSTFQYYVELSDNYKGEDILKIYSQSVKKREKKDIDFRNIRPKYLCIYIKELGIDMSNYKGRVIDDLYEFLEAEYRKKTLVYDNDIEESLSILMNILLKNIFFQKTNSKDILPNNLILNIEENKILDILQEYKEYHNEDKVILNNFRQFFFSRGSKYSTPKEIYENYNEYIKYIQQYCHFKFFQFSNYINIQNIID